MTPGLLHRHVRRLEGLEERVNLSPPTVTNLRIDDGCIQRSMIRSLTVTFSEAVTFTGPIAGAITLNRNAATLMSEQGGATGLVNLNAVQAGSVVTITFSASGPNPIFGVGGVGNLSIPDGRYTLTIDASHVSGVDGQLDGNGDGVGGDNYLLASAGSSGIFRLFGDVTGDNDVSSSDFAWFRTSFGGSNPYFDYDGNGSADTSDFVRFRMRFGYPGPP